MQEHGWQADHWSTLGDARASDQEIMAWAREHDAIVFTHDLDFGSILASTNAQGPSVLQVRTQDVTPDSIGAAIIAAARQFENILKQGAIIVVDPARVRARVLPLQSE